MLFSFFFHFSSDPHLQKHYVDWIQNKLQNKTKQNKIKTFLPNAEMEGSIESVIVTNINFWSMICLVVRRSLHMK